MITSPKSLSQSVSRRRCLNIIAASCATGLSGLTGLANAADAASPTAQHKLTWSGIILGANATITLYADNADTAKRSISDMLSQIETQENHFSLFKPASLINRLNQQGSLDSPPAEFYELIKFAINFAEATEGHFDPTIQPLFMAYKKLGSENKIPAHQWSETESVKSAKELISWKNIKVEKSKITLRKSGMALTLNGVAQGFITDKAVQILKTQGYQNTLVNFGEYYALGQPQIATHLSNQTAQISPLTPNLNSENTSSTSQITQKTLDWQVQLGKSANNSDETRPIWSLKNQALAASDRTGYIFDENSGLHHMLAPKTGGNQQAWQEIYILAKNATIADAASTALFASDPVDINRIFKATNANKALIINQDGIHQTI